EFLFSGKGALLGFGNIVERFAMLILQLNEPFVVKMDAAFMPVRFAFEFEAAMLRLADFLFEFGHPLAKLDDLVFNANNRFAGEFELEPQFFKSLLTFGYFSLQHIELMPRELRIEMLQLV